MTAHYLIYSEYFYPMYHGVPVTSDLLATAFERLGFSPAVYTTTPLGDAAPPNRCYVVFRRREIVRLLWRFINAPPRAIVVKGGVAIKAFALLLPFHCPMVVWHEMAHTIDYSTGRPLIDAVYRGCARLAMNLVNLHVGIAPAVLRAKRLPARVAREVIFNAIRPIYFEAPATVASPSYDFCYVGRVNLAKGALLLMDSLEILDSAGVSLRMCFVGDGEDIVEVRRRAQRLSTITVEFLGILPPERLVHVYDNSYYLVMPSHTHPEGMGLVAAESMARGTPVVAADQDAIREVFAEAACYFSRGSAVSLAAVLRAAISNNDERLRRSALASRRAPLFHSSTQDAALVRLDRRLAQQEGCVV